MPHGDPWVWFQGRPELRTKLRAWIFEKERTWRGLRRTALHVFLVGVIGLREFHRSLGFERAATLAFATILSLIPAAVLFVSVAGMLGGGDRITEWVEETVLPNAAPEFRIEVRHWLKDNISKNAFQAANTGLVNALGIFGLLSAAVLLLTVAERLFNRIWHVRLQRSWVQRLMVFWVILTTAPLFISGSIALEQYLFSSESSGALASWPWLRGLLGFLLPLAVAQIGFTIVLAKLPNTVVRWHSAAIGALVATLLWQLTKSAFYLYIAQSAGVSSFYGRIAYVPLFLVWIYVSWLLVLVGVNIAFVHQNLLGLLREEKHGPEGAKRSRMFLGIELLWRRREVFARRAPETALEDEAGELAVASEVLREVASSLAKKGYLLEDGEKPGRFVLARAPEQIALAEVARELLEEQFPGEMNPSKEYVPGPADGVTAEAWGAYLKALAERNLSQLDRPPRST